VPLEAASNKAAPSKDASIINKDFTMESIMWMIGEHVGVEFVAGSRLYKLMKTLQQQLVKK
jgi:hypothetical protein